MSSRKIRHGGQMRKASDIISRTKKYKYNKQGSLVEITGAVTLADDEFKFAGSKSSLRRMADLERNVSLLINKVSTSDGEADDGNDDNFDNNINKDTRFKKDVQLGNGSSDEIDVYGHLDIKNGLTLGSTAQEVIRDLAGGMASTGLTFSDSGNTIKVDETRIATRSYVDTGLGSKVSTNSAQALSSSANALTFSANTLTLARGDGTTDTVNLSAYLDDTNAAKITSGSMASNGVATFTRDDSSTFTVDMSVLLDNDNLARITSASWNDGNGVLTLTRNDSSAITVDLDNRYALNDSAQALRSTDALTVSNDTITIHKADGTSESVTTSDANTNKFISAMSFNTSNGVLTATRNDGGTVTVDLDGRFTDNGYADTMNQHVRTSDSPTFVEVNATATKAKYADLAERYAADAPYTEGTVVVFGGEAEVTACTGFAQRSVAGVVSTKPAVMMNSEAGNSQTHPYIALQGRVPVKVTGDVKKGDILVASDVAGTATAWDNENADPRMTAYVGIAIADAVDGFVEVKVGK